MPTDVPLLSSYKREFVKRRLFHTLTGVRLFVGQTPCRVRAAQLVLWLLPAAVGVVSSLVLPRLPALLVAGVGVAAVTLGAQLVSRYKQSTYSIVV